MSPVVGRIGKKEVTATFKDGSVTFKHKDEVFKSLKQTWFVYFQRVSKRLKTCDAVFFDGEWTTTDDLAREMEKENASWEDWFDELVGAELERRRR